MKYNKFSLTISSTNAAFKVEPKTVDSCSLIKFIDSANWRIFSMHELKQWFVLFVNSILFLLFSSGLAGCAKKPVEIPKNYTPPELGEEDFDIGGEENVEEPEEI